MSHALCSTLQFNAASKNIVNFHLPAIHIFLFLFTFFVPFFRSIGMRRERRGGSITTLSSSEMIKRREIQSQCMTQWRCRWNFHRSCSFFIFLWFEHYVPFFFSSLPKVPPTIITYYARTSDDYGWALSARRESERESGTETKSLDRRKNSSITAVKCSRVKKRRW